MNLLFHKQFLPICFILLTSCSSLFLGPKNNANETWFPMQIGNYWVYTDSVWKNNELMKASIDTVRIIDTFNYKGYSAYRFSNKTAFYNQGGDIYQIFKTESNNNTSTLAFTRLRTKYNYTLEGDVSIERNALPTSKAEIIYCGGGERITIKQFVGITTFESEKSVVQNTVKRKRNLLDHKLIKD